MQFLLAALVSCAAGCSADPFIRGNCESLTACGSRAALGNVVLVLGRLLLSAAALVLLTSAERLVAGVWRRVACIFVVPPAWPRLDAFVAIRCVFQVAAVLRAVSRRGPPLLALA